MSNNCIVTGTDDGWINIWSAPKVGENHKVDSEFLYKWGLQFEKSIKVSNKEIDKIFINDDGQMFAHIDSNKYAWFHLFHYVKPDKSMKFVLSESL